MYVDTGISCTAVNLAAEQTAYVGVLMMQKKVKKENTQA